MEGWRGRVPRVRLVACTNVDFNIMNGLWGYVAFEAMQILSSSWQIDISPNCVCLKCGFIYTYILPSLILRCRVSTGPMAQW